MIKGYCNTQFMNQGCISYCSQFKGLFLLMILDDKITFKKIIGWWWILKKIIGR